MVAVQPLPGPVARDAAGVAEVAETPGQRKGRLALAGFLLLMGVLHLAMPKPFAKIIPSWVPGDPKLWAYVSGVWELSSGALLAVPRTRRLVLHSNRVGHDFDARLLPLANRGLDRFVRGVRTYSHVVAAFTLCD